MSSPQAIRVLPRADAAALGELVGDRRSAVFLDYDGTLTPIVDDPAAATLDPGARAAVERLAAACPVAVVSGRDLDDVRGMVGLDGLHYAGSHGFDILTPDGDRHERAPEALPHLEAAEADLVAAVAHLPGVDVERKRYAVAVHFRRAAAEAVPDTEAAVDAAVTRHGLRKTGGKKIFELRPDVEWDKGRALRWLLDLLDLAGPDVVPVYIGDDVTDEDAFAAVSGSGVGIVVQGEDDDRETVADLALASPADVPALLDGLAERLGG